MNYYVGVQYEDGVIFVTRVYQIEKICFLNKDKKPLPFTLELATELAKNLRKQKLKSVIIPSYFELTEHFICEKEEIK